MGHPPPNHDIGKVMASCTLRMHLKGCLSTNLVVLVVKLLLNGENFLVSVEDVFVPVIGMPREETLCSCPLGFLQSRSKVCVPLSRGVLLHGDCPWWGITWLGRYVQLSGHDLLFPQQISANPLPYCFDSNFSPHTFQESWTSPIFNPPEFLIMFNCQIDEHSQNFQWF